MHMQFLVHGILHATVLAVIGFFVLAVAAKASGTVRLVGNLLGWWLWLLAVLSIVCAVACPMMGDKGGGWMKDHMGGWMHSHDGAPAPDTAAPAKPDAAPATPGPKKP